MSEKWKRILVLKAMMVVFTMVLTGSLVQASETMNKEEKTDMAEVRKETNEALQSIKAYSIDKKNEAMAKAKEMMDKMDAKIDELEKQSSEKWQQMSEASRKKSEETLKELRKKRNDIAEWYGGMKQSSSKAWEEVKKGFVDSYHSLQKAFDKAAEKF